MDHDFLNLSDIFWNENHQGNSYLYFEFGHKIFPRAIGENKLFFYFEGKDK